MASWFEGGGGKDKDDEISVQPGESTISKEELVIWNSILECMHNLCDWVWENMHSSHIRNCSFGDP